jgi:membrane fusion protein (multidrug efflux system)
MKRFVYLFIATTILASCGGKKTVNKTEELATLKKQRSELDTKIQELEASTPDTSKKGTPVSIIDVTYMPFNATVDVQAQVTGDQNVLATPQAPGIVRSIMVRPGQKVGRGQTLAVLDATVVEQQIKALEPTLSLQRALYEKQQKLWAQNIGTEVQLLTAKAQYEATQKQKAALQAQRAMYTIKSPISGIVDAVPIKEGDAVNPGMNGIKVVNLSELKATAALGENYLGKVQQGDPVKLVFIETGDTIKSRLSYVSKAVDPISRAFQVEVRLGNNANLHPNMSCKMQIVNYEKKDALAVPISVIQKTAEGDMVYVIQGNKAKSVIVTTGRTANGMIEVLTGLNNGDKVVTEGYEDLDNGETVAIQ